jgi:hypothetical protein
MKRRHHTPEQIIRKLHEAEQTPRPARSTMVWRLRAAQLATRSSK